MGMIVRGLVLLLGVFVVLIILSAVVGGVISVILACVALLVKAAIFIFSFLVSMAGFLI